MGAMTKRIGCIAHDAETNTTGVIVRLNRSMTTLMTDEGKKTFASHRIKLRRPKKEYSEKVQRMAKAIGLTPAAVEEELIEGNQ